MGKNYSDKIQDFKKFLSNTLSSVSKKLNEQKIRCKKWLYDALLRVHSVLESYKIRTKKFVISLLTNVRNTLKKQLLLKGVLSVLSFLFLYFSTEYLENRSLAFDFIYGLAKLLAGESSEVAFNFGHLLSTLLEANCHSRLSPAHLLIFLWWFVIFGILEEKSSFYRNFCGKGILKGNLAESLSHTLSVVLIQIWACGSINISVITVFFASSWLLALIREVVVQKLAKRYS